MRASGEVVMCSGWRSCRTDVDASKGRGGLFCDLLLGLALRRSEVLMIRMSDLRYTFSFLLHFPLLIPGTWIRYK